MWRRLSHVAEVSVSTVDKHTVDGEVPVRLCNYVDVYKNSSIVDGLDFMSATATPEEIRRFSIEPGDTLFTKDSETADDIGVPAYVQTCESLVCGYHVAIARPRVGAVHPRYLYWSMASSAAAQQWQVLATGVTRVGLRQGDIGKLSVWVPHPHHQRVITDFLDRETAKIDALIAKQEVLTHSALEHRDALILGLITGDKGAAKREASGVDWIGDMPEHWETRPLRHVLASVETGVWGSEPAVEGEGTPCARVADFDRERLQVADPIPTLRDVSPEDLQRRGLRRSDLLIERSGGTHANPVGFVVSFESDTEAVCSNFVSRLRVREQQIPRYWLYAFYAARLTRITEKWTKQTTGIQNLDFGGFSSEPFPCPPASEQAEIAEEIDQIMGDSDAQLQRQRELDRLLRERRAALITAAVTGKLDVTTYGKAG